MNKNIISKELVEQICKEVTTVADFCRKVGWQPRGDNYKIFYKYVKEFLNINVLNVENLYDIILKQVYVLTV